MKLKTIYLIFSFWSIFISLVSAQVSSNKDPLAKLATMIDIEKSNLQIVYTHNSFDPVLKETEKTTDILVVGAESSLYQNYGVYRIDLALDSVGRDKARLSDMGRLMAQYKDADNFSFFLVKWNKKKELLLNQYVSMGSMQYRESLPEMQWILCNNIADTIILGHNCKKATLSFRGRIWTVWYATDLKNSDGPWKFHGLPGLILLAESADGDHKFQAQEILTEERMVRYQDRSNSAFKTTREKFNKALKQHRINPSQSMAGLVTKSDGSPYKVDRKFYCPEELE